MIFKFKGSRNSGKIQQENIKKLQKQKNKFNENSQVMMTLTNEMHKCL